MAGETPDSQYYLTNGQKSAKRRGKRTEGCLVKALYYKGSIQAYAISATEAVNEAQRRYDTWSSSIAASGCTLTGALLLGATLKGDNRLTVRVQGNDPTGAIIVDSNGRRETKGYIRSSHVSLKLNITGRIDVHGAVGNEGIFTATEDLGLKETLSGQTLIVSGEIGKDFTYFMTISEQVPSVIGLGALADADGSVEAAGGFVIQVMLGANESTIDFIEQRLAEVPPISQLLESGETPEQVLYRLSREDGVEIPGKMSIQFKRDYSREKFVTALIAVGIDRLNAMTDGDHGAEVVC